MLHAIDLGMQITHMLGKRFGRCTRPITYGNGKKVYRFFRFTTSNYLKWT